MTNNQTDRDEPGTRPAKPGEVCTCGAPAEVTFETARFGDVPYCGGHPGGPEGGEGHAELSAGSTYRAELAELRASLAGEVRTRRIVVVDDEGRERLYSTVQPKWTELVIEHPYETRSGPKVTVAADGAHNRAAVNVWADDEVGVGIEAMLLEGALDAEVTISGPSGPGDERTRSIRATPAGDQGQGSGASGGRGEGQGDDLEGYDPSRVTDRRQLLEVVAIEGTGGLAESLGKDEVIDATLQAMAREMVFLGEELSIQQDAAKVIGAMVAGLFDLGRREPEPDADPEGERLMSALYDSGARLRRAAGIGPSTPPAT